MPRSWHSFTSYFSCMPTGSPHFSQKVGVFLLNVPHLVQSTSPVLIRIGDDGSAAIPAGGAQVVQTLQVAALAFPVADRIVHKIQLRQAAEILNRKHRSEYRLQAAVFALGRKQIHLQEIADRNSSEPRSGSGSGWSSGFWRNPAARVPAYDDFHFHSACFDLINCAGLGRDADRRHGRHCRPGSRRDRVKVNKSRFGTCVSKPLRARQVPS